MQKQDGAQRDGAVRSMKCSAVFVDAPIWPLGRMMMCHMISENIEALHAMADKIGVSRRHFQQKRTPHYDICKAKRKLAVKNGAMELGRNAFVGLMRRIRQNGKVSGADPTARSRNSKTL